MTTVRPAAVAGTFYPADPVQLAAMVDGLLRAVPPVDAATAPVALIVPHAGYVYSGPTAAAAYARLERWRGSIRRVVVAGPAHRALVDGLAVPSSSGFATPLGVVPLDRDAVGSLLERPGVHVDDGAHLLEHSIEVQLPFLQRLLGDEWQLVPVVAGSLSAPRVADALEPLWGRPGTLVVVSSDLSHYHGADTARRLDAATAAEIVDAAWESVSPDRACGAVPLRGALELVRRHAAQVSLLDLRTSADTAGSADRVVGYGSFVVEHLPRREAVSPR